MKPENTRIAAVSRMGDVYLEDNISLTRDGKPAPMVAWVTAQAGARPKDRDAVDSRIVRDLELAAALE